MVAKSEPDEMYGCVRDVEMHTGLVLCRWYERGVHDRGCIPILAQSYISNILIQNHSDVSFIHKCELDQRATMMLVWPACVL